MTFISKWRKTFAILGIGFLVILYFNYSGNSSYQPKTGDIVFQSSLSGQGKAIALATRSAYTHCGIVVVEDGTPYVFEAVQPVRKITLERWKKNGEGSAYKAMRLKSDYQFHLKDVNWFSIIKKWNHRNYDIKFDWTDDQLYCSELVWKVFDRWTDVQLCPLRRFKDYDVSSDIAQSIIKKRFGNKFPMEQQVVAPSDLMESPWLEDVN